MECLRHQVASGRRPLAELEDGARIHCDWCELMALVITRGERKGVIAAWEKCRSGFPLSNEDTRRELKGGVLG